MNARSALGALAVAALPACAEPAAPPSAPQPERHGAVLSVAGEPITAAEVERMAAAAADVLPGRVESERARVALREELVPRAALAARFAGERAAALAAAREGLAALRAGGEAGAPESVQGTWDAFGLGVWAGVRAAPVGAWGEPFEGPGVVYVARVERRREAAMPAETFVEASLRLWTYAPADFGPEDLAALLAESPLAVLDPDYEALVPAELRYAMPRPEDRP